MSSYRGDYEWQRRFLPEIAQIIGGVLITVASEAEDRHHNTDLELKTDKGHRIAARVRTHQWMWSNGDEFTIRTHRPSGAKTELAKILEGWGDYNFYGFADSTDTGLAAWVLGDLDVFRTWVTSPAGREYGGDIENRDQSSSFIPYRLKDLPAEFIIGRKEPDLFKADLGLDLDRGRLGMRPDACRHCGESLDRPPLSSYRKTRCRPQHETAGSNA